MTAERFVQHNIMKFWGAHPRLRFWRTNVGRAQIKGQWVQFNIPGQSDLTGLIAPGGRFLAVECKRGKGGVQSPEQVAYQQMIERMGGLYVLAPSLEAMDLAMAKIGIYR